MRSPLQAMLWLVWRGSRWNIVVGIVYTIVVVLAVPLLPPILRWLQIDEAELPMIGKLLAMPYSLFLIQLASIFTLTGPHAKERGNCLFVLPVSTRTLASLPFLWCCLAVGCVWLIASCFILRPSGTMVPWVWPAAAIAAGLTMLQAISSLPLAQFWLYPVIAVPMISIVTLGVAFVRTSAVPEPIATGLFLCQLPLIYLAILYGLSAARRGEVYELRLWNRLVSWQMKMRKPADHPFASMRSAHVWYECRSYAWTLPLMTALIVPAYIMMLLAGQGADVPATWRLLAGLLFLPALLTPFLGGALGHAAFPFIATRPLSTEDLVRCKYSMALISSLLAYIPVFSVVPLFFIWPTFTDAVVQSAKATETPNLCMILLLSIVLPLLLTWKGIVEHLWVGLSGREWLGNVIAFGVAAMIAIGTFGGLWLSYQPELQATLRSLIPWFAGGLLFLKFALGASMVAVLVRSKLTTIPNAEFMVGLWSVVVALLCLVAAWLIPQRIFTIQTLIMAAALFVPFSRLAASTLMLSWNRHR